MSSSYMPIQAEQDHRGKLSPKGKEPEEAATETGGESASSYTTLRPKLSTESNLDSPDSSVLAKGSGMWLSPTAFPVADTVEMRSRGASRKKKKKKDKNEGGNADKDDGRQKPKGGAGFTSYATIILTSKS